MIVECSVLNGSAMSHPSFQSSEMVREQLYKPKVLDDYKEMMFARHKGRCTYELKMIISACTRPVQAQIRQICITRIGSPNIPGPS